MFKKILEAHDVCKSFIEANKTHSVLNGISQVFRQGQTYAITGASGSGKSTLLHILGGLDHPTTGSVSLDGRDFIERSAIGFVFQFHYLINELTVLENIILMGLIDGKPKHKCIEKAHELLAFFGLEDKAKSMPYNLSGGEQQRISIIRAIFNKPAFLLADEPTGNLDAANAEKIVEFFLQCQKEWDLGIIICSHDKSVYKRMETVFELKNGTLYE